MGVGGGRYNFTRVFPRLAPAPSPQCIVVGTLCRRRRCCCSRKSRPGHLHPCSQDCVGYLHVPFRQQTYAANAQQCRTNTRGLPCLVFSTRHELANPGTAREIERREDEQRKPASSGLSSSECLGFATFTQASFPTHREHVVWIWDRPRGKGER